MKKFFIKKGKTDKKEEVQQENKESSLDVEMTSREDAREDAQNEAQNDAREDAQNDVQNGVHNDVQNDVQNDIQNDIQNNGEEISDEILDTNLNENSNEALIKETDKAENDTESQAQDEQMAEIPDESLPEEEGMDQSAQDEIGVDITQTYILNDPNVAVPDNDYEDFDETLSKTQQANQAMLSGYQNQEEYLDVYDDDVAIEDLDKDLWTEDEINSEDDEEKENKKDTKKNKSSKNKSSKNKSSKNKSKSGKGDKDKNKSKKSGKEEGGFVDFIQEAGSNFTKWFQKNARVCIIVASCLVVIGAVIAIISVVCNHSDSPESVSLDEISQNVTDAGVIPVPTDPLELNAYPEVNALVESYFTALQSYDVTTLNSLRNYIDEAELVKIQIKSQYIEEYQNINCYTKKGPIDNSYLVYVSYEIKFKDWDVAAPSLSTILVCTRDNGSLYVYCGEFDQNVADYILSISKQDDVVDLLNRVETMYNEVMDENPEMETFMTSLNQTIKDGVGEYMVSQEDSASENAVSENAAESVSDNETASENTAPSTFEVRTNTTVNVRVSDSEQADKLGRAESGTVLTCREQKANGWSEVIFENQVGYIKSDYVTVVGDENSETDESLPATNGTVTVKDTVNIRSTASVDGERVGVAYAGQTFDLVEKGSNWTKIIYNGETAYIKTDYIQ